MTPLRNRPAPGSPRELSEEAAQVVNTVVTNATVSATSGEATDLVVATERLATLSSHVREKVLFRVDQTLSNPKTVDALIGPSIKRAIEAEVAKVLPELLHALGPVVNDAVARVAPDLLEETVKRALERTQEKIIRAIG